MVNEVVTSRTLEELRELFADFSGQWTPALDTLEIIDDPQVVANGYVQDAVTEDGVPFKLVAVPVQFNGEPAAPGRAPGFNEHGDEILTENLGMDWDDVIDLKIKGVVA